LSFHRHLTVITETQEDSSIIKTYPTTIKPKNQETKGDVRDCSKKKRVYPPLAGGQNTYVRACQAKTRVYVPKHNQAKEKAKEKDKKLRLRVNRG
jgi:hypothetical protein